MNINQDRYNGQNSPIESVQREIDGLGRQEIDGGLKKTTMGFPSRDPLSRAPQSYLY